LAVTLLDRTEDDLTNNKTESALLEDSDLWHL